MIITTMKQVRKDFEKEVLDIHYERSKNLYNLILKETTKHLNKTINPSPGTIHQGFQGAYVRVKRDITRTNSGVKVIIHAYVANFKVSGKPHKIWHLINAGHSYIASDNHVVPISDVQPRTALKSFNFAPGSKDFKFVTLTKGRRYSWTGRKWYGITIKAVRDDLSKDIIESWDIKTKVVGNDE